MGKAESVLMHAAVKCGQCEVQAQYQHNKVKADLQGLVDLLPGGLGGVQSVNQLNIVQQIASCA